MQETRARSLAKAVTWQVLGLVVTTFSAYALTGEASVAGTFALVMAAIGFVANFVHERLWARVRWGWRAREASLRPGRAAAGS